MDYCIPRLSFHLVSRTKGEAPLTKEEKQLRKILSKANSKTGFGSSIKVALDSRSNSKFRQLITELKDQLRDAPKELQRAISEEGIELLKQLK